MKGLLLLGCFLAVRAYNDLDMGFFLIPRNQAIDAPVMALALTRASELEIQHLSQDSHAQLFIQERVRKGKICLKHHPDNCIRIAKVPISQGSTFVKKYKMCSVTKLATAKLFLEVTPYSQQVMVRIHECRALCVYSHHRRQPLGSKNYFVNLGFCRAGQMNNLFTFIDETQIESYLADRHLDRHLLDHYNPQSDDTDALNHIVSHALSYPPTFSNIPTSKLVRANSIIPPVLPRIYTTHV
ncbi:hypothetical protein NEHOM01_0077 [Nematocida homosporus]|uniref:uncharacterized protein n=1 Tax=Nematocida homosporus TaxID=1912981 RepID=UPI00221EE396|nr:uncharacterized protein NEHOM01_0077 [Nematocida homosporus]KAI5184332.1 hypothetical protein NEHOM01_0077 [Nematocida homosporus]